MKLSGHTPSSFTLAAALCLFCVVGGAASAFPKSALLPARSAVPDLVIMALSAGLGVMGGLLVFLRTRARRSRLR